MASDLKGAVSAAGMQGLDLLQKIIRARKGIMACGDEYAVSVTDGGRVRFAGSNAYGQEKSSGWQNIRAVYGSRDYLLGLTEDGRILFSGRDLHGICAGVSHWCSVDMVACSPTRAAALLLGGRVVCVGDSENGCDETAEWIDVRDICCGRDFTLGLTSSGRVLIAGGSIAFREYVNSWGTVAGIFSDALGNHAYAITADGHLAATRRLPVDMRDRSNLVFAAVSGDCICTLTADGRVCAENRIDTAGWGRGFVSLSAGCSRLLALDRQGRVTAAVTGRQRFPGKGRVSDDIDIGWSDLTGWLPLFDTYERFSTGRRNLSEKLQRDGRMYQIRRTQAVRYGRRLACGERMTACIAADGHVLVTGGLEKPQTWREITALSCGASHILALRSDGSVQADGSDTDGCCRTETWKTIVGVLAFRAHSLGLTADGHVRYAGAPDTEISCVSGWTDIRMLRGSETLVLGVTKDGSIRFCGHHAALDAACRRRGCEGTAENINTLFEDWSNLRDVVISEHVLAGLRADGTVVALSEDGDIEASAAEWRNIRTVAVGARHLAGLEYGGRVVAAGNNAHGQCETDGWHQVTSVACSDACTVGLRMDGTAVSAGKLHTGGPNAVYSNGWVRCAVDGWSHLLAVCCGRNHVAAMTDGGQILSYGRDTDGQCSGVASFSVFYDLRQFDGYTIFGSEDSAGADPLPQQQQPEKSRRDDRASFSNASGWFPYAPILRDVADRLAANIQCDEDGLTILTPEGTFRWLYGEHRLICEKDEIIRRTDEGQNVRIYIKESAKGRLIAVGDNQEGQCDTGSWKEIVAGSTSGSHTVGLRSNGRLLATGRNTSGECEVNDWSRVVQVAALPGITLALRADGRVLHTGKGGKELDSLCGVVAMTGSGGHASFVMSDGSLLVYHTGSTASPEKVEGFRLFCPSAERSILSRWNSQTDRADCARMVRRQIGCGLAHAVRILPRGRVAFVGSDEFGQCDVTDLKGVTAVACGLNHTAAVADGRVHTVGLGRDGQCADTMLNAALVNASDGQSRTGAACYLTVACGYEHTAALRGDGRVFAVGASPDGRCDTSQWHDVVDIACGVRHTAAVLSDGHCVAVGDNSRGQCMVDNWKNVTMIACGEFHTVGVTADGRVLAAGSSGEEQCRVGDLRDVISVACLPDATICIHADGHVTLRGGDDALAEAVAPIRDAVAADGTEYHLLILTADRRVLFLPS